MAIIQGNLIWVELRTWLAKIEAFSTVYGQGGGEKPQTEWPKPRQIQTNKRLTHSGQQWAMCQMNGQSSATGQLEAGSCKLKTGNWELGTGNWAGENILNANEVPHLGSRQLSKKRKKKSGECWVPLKMADKLEREPGTMARF